MSNVPARVRKAALLRDRRRQHRAAARIRRRGNGSLTTYALATGLRPRDAASMTSTLRRVAERIHITGTPARVRRARAMRTTHRYTPGQVATICTVYKPRRDAFKRAARTLAAA